jgi:CBS domain-containing protein
LGTTIPVVVANMTAVAGRRMAETVARRGGITVLPQDIPLDVLETVIDYVKTRHLVYDTPITLSPTHTVGDALGLIHKRAHGAVVIVDDDGRPEGIFTEHDAAGYDRFTQLKNVMSRDLVVLEDGTAPAEIYDRLSGQRLSVAPVVDGEGRLHRLRHPHRCVAQHHLLAGGGQPTNACSWPPLSASTATRPRRPRRCCRSVPTCSSSTPRTATRPAPCAPSRKSARLHRACRSWRATWSPSKARATSSARAPTSSRWASAPARCARRA